MRNTYGSLVDRFDVDRLDDTAFTLEEIGAARGWVGHDRLRPVRPTRMSPAAPNR